MDRFRPDGSRFDGRGIAVDLDARPTIEDDSINADSVLDRGVGVILKMNH